MSGPLPSNLVSKLRDLSNRLRDSGRYSADECDLAAASLIDEAIAALQDETPALRLPDDPHELLVITARDAGFSDTQWKAMFYEQGPYDVTFPCFTTKKFVALLLERLQVKTSPAAGCGYQPKDSPLREPPVKP